MQSGVNSVYFGGQIPACEVPEVPEIPMLTLLPHHSYYYPLTSCGKHIQHDIRSTWLRSLDARFGTILISSHGESPSSQESRNWILIMSAREITQNRGTNKLECECSLKVQTFQSSHLFIPLNDGVCRISCPHPVRAPKLFHVE